jgi:hypothetical protein
MLRRRRTTTTDNSIKTLDPTRQVANVLDEQGKVGPKAKIGTIGSTI